MTGPWNIVTSHGARAAVLATAILLAGCNTPDDPLSGAVNTGTYPNLNVMPSAAGPQLSTEERAAAVASLKGAVAGQTASGSGAGASASEAELQRLRATHREEALKEICAPRPTC